MIVLENQIAVDGEIVPASRTLWYVDAGGLKHPAPADPSWQPVACLFHQELERNADGLWALPDMAARARRALLDYAAARRFAVETGGIAVAGAAVRTDRESQALINGARALAEAEPAELIEFKGEFGWVTLDSGAMIAIARAVGAHVRACFRKERAVVEAITAEPPTITTTAEIDAAFAAL